MDNESIFQDNKQKAALKVNNAEHGNLGNLVSTQLF